MPAVPPIAHVDGAPCEGRAYDAIDAAHRQERRKAGRHLPLVPASFFGIVLGLAGLGSAWRAATSVWGAPPFVGEFLMLGAAVVWAVVLVLYIAKWFVATAAARSEALHPVQCCFIGLAGVATMIVALGLAPYDLMIARLLFIAGSLFTFGFGIWRTGDLWKGERDPAANTPVLYLPAVAGGFVTATVASVLGMPELAKIAFGAGLLSWLAIESVIFHRLYTGAQMPPALRPTLGIQLAPSTVGGIACVSVLDGPPGILTYVLLGYGLLQALILLRLLPWICEGGFTMGFWGFSFGATALGALPLRILERAEAPLLSSIAPYLFIASNAVVLVLIAASLRLALAGQLLAHPPARG